MTTTTATAATAATAPAATAPDIPGILAKLDAYLAALGDGRDCKSDREKAAWFASTTTCHRTVSRLRNLPTDVARQQAHLDDLTESRAVVAAKVAEIEQAILDAPPASDAQDARERDRRHDHVAHLRRQLALLHVGALMAGPGVTYERLDVLDRQIAEVTRRRDAAQSALDAHLAEAERLLAAAVA